MYKKGFSLVELLVVIAIGTLVLTTVIFNYRGSQNKLVVSTAGQELAITIRQAQTYGIAVKSQSGQFNYAYGVYLNPATDPDNYYLFADLNSNGVYDAGSGCGSGSTECVQKSTFRNGVKSSSVCSNSTCYSSGTRSINITFLRPNPNTIIKVTGGGVTSSPSSGSVTLTSTSGDTVTIKVESTGQILVQ